MPFFFINKNGKKKVQNVPSLNGHVGANFGSQGVLMPEFSHTGQPNVQDGGSPGENFAQERVFGTPRSMDFTTGAGQKTPRPNQEGGSWSGTLRSPMGTPPVVHEHAVNPRMIDLKVVDHDGCDSCVILPSNTMGKPKICSKYANYVPFSELETPEKTLGEQKMVEKDPNDKSGQPRNFSQVKDDFWGIPKTAKGTPVQASCGPESFTPNHDVIDRAELVQGEVLKIQKSFGDPPGGP